MIITPRLHQAIAAVCPIVGVRIGNLADRSTWTFDATPAATQAERDAAQAVIDSFDDSGAAQAAWELSVTRADVLDQLDADGSKYAVIIRAALRLLNANINQVRQQLGMPTLTWAQAKTQLRQLLQNGQGNPEA